MTLLIASRFRRLDARAVPFLIVDAHYERALRESHQLSIATLWVIDMRAHGDREYLGCGLGNADSTERWSAMRQDQLLVGLHDSQCIVNDEHADVRNVMLSPALPAVSVARPHPL